MRHKNCKGTEDFNQNMASIFEYYKAAVQEVLQLCDIWVNHPANAMIGVMKQAGFSKKLIAETVEATAHQLESNLAVPMKSIVESVMLFQS